MSEPTTKKAAATRRASSVAAASSMKKKAAAQSTSDFVKFSKFVLQMQMLELQSQLDLLDELSKMSDDEKLETLFSLIDRDGDGKIDARELAQGLRSLDEDLAFGESLEAAVASVATFDTDADAKLDKAEFKKFLEELLGALDCTFHELSELLVMQVLSSDSFANPLEEAIGDMISEPLDEAVMEAEIFRTALTDERMVALFTLFDVNNDNAVEFKEVALGLYKMTDDMEESSRAALAALLMYDEDENKTLDYVEFTKLVLNVISTAPDDVSFDEMIDDMLKAAAMPAIMSEEDLAMLVVADEMQKAVMELEETAREIAEVVDAVQYGRMQRLFDLWDLDHDGSIDFSELALGMRKFQEAKDMEDTIAETVAAMLTFDENDDQKLDRVEFAVFLAKYAQAAEIDLHELIDFMVVASALKDNSEAEKAYIKRIGAEASEEIKAIEAKLKEM
mmetsp:Transcript_16377/g.35580  ORF Transcript_16377/g.35580 Transcript_16377/m.35580 type:complete len:450 (+) Transcript_16377:31-1380(+)